MFLSLTCLRQGVLLTANPSAGWSFAGWSGDLTGLVNPASLSMTANKTVTATFTLDTFVIVDNVVGGGSVSRNVSEPYVFGQGVLLTANPSAGWSFAGWSGDLTGLVNPASLSMTANKTVTATFTLDTFVIVDNVVGGGSVSRNVSEPYVFAQGVLLTANPSAGWSFAGWSGDLTGLVNPASLSMTANKTVTATFTLDTFVIVDNVVGGGSVSRNVSEPYVFAPGCSFNC